MTAEDAAASHAAVQAQRRGGTSWQGRLPDGEGTHFYNHIGAACLTMGLLQISCAHTLRYRILAWRHLGIFACCREGWRHCLCSSCSHRACMHPSSALQFPGL